MSQERFSTCFTVILLTHVYHKRCNGNADPPCGPWKVEKRPRFCSTLRGSLFGLQWKAPLSSASHLLRHEAKPVTDGAFAQRYALCQRPPERLRCVVTRKKQQFQNRRRGHRPRGVEFFQLLTPNGVVTKMFSCAEEVYFFYFYFFNRAGCAETTINMLWTVLSKTCDETAKHDYI